MVWFVLTPENYLPLAKETLSPLVSYLPFACVTTPNICMTHFAALGQW
jgi:hypothetical protein